MSIKSIADARFLIAATAAAVGIFSATPGHASVVTMTFTGTYDSLQSTGGAVDGITPSAGLTAFGSLSFDPTKLTLSVNGSASNGPYQIYTGPVMFTATVDSKTYTSSTVLDFKMSNANYSAQSQYFEAQALSSSGVYMDLNASSLSSTLFGNPNNLRSFSQAINGEFNLSTDPSDVTPKLVFDVSMNVSVVPEPSTWAMMILGFLGVGFMAYRKKSALSFV